MAKTTKIVVRLKPNHPSGQRKRAGFKFDTKGQMVEVTAQQKAELESDKHLFIITKGTAYKNALEQFEGKRSDNPELTVDQENDIFFKMIDNRTFEQLEKLFKNLEEAVNIDKNIDKEVCKQYIVDVYDLAINQDQGGKSPVDGGDDEGDQNPEGGQDDQGGDDQGQPDANQTGEGEENVNPEVKKFGKLISRMNKKDLIEALEKEGQVKGKDFEEETSNKNLKALLEATMPEAT